MTTLQRSNQHKDTLNNLNNNTDKHLKLIATKKIREMDEYAVNIIS